MFSSSHSLRGNLTNTELAKFIMEAVLLANEKYFYDLLKFAKHKKEIDFIDFIHTMTIKDGKTPWHYAAFLGHAHFFTSPNDHEEKEIWQLLKAKWLNRADQMGNTPLHLASVYAHGESEKKVKAKKKTVANFLSIPELDLEARNKNNKTALHLAIEKGCYASCRELLRVRKTEKEKELTEEDDKGKDKASAPQFSSQTLDEVYLLSIGHQRITAAIEFHRNPKISTSSELINKEIIEQYAEQVNIDNNEFVKKLKNVVDIELAKHAINIRVKKLAERDARDNKKKALLSSIDSAFGAATFFGLIGGAIGGALSGGLLIPVAAAICTLVAFPVIYIPLVYTSYKSQSCSSQYDAESAETLYLTWLATALPSLEKNEYNNLPDIMELSETNKPKLKLQYITREEFREKKTLGYLDPIESRNYAGKTNSAIALGNFINNVICPAGACLAIISSGLSLFAWGTGALGVGIFTSIMSGPFAPLVLGTVGLLAIVALISFVTNKAYYNRPKAEMGEKARELLMTHDRCKRSLDMMNKPALHRELIATSQAQHVEYPPASDVSNKRAWRDCFGLFRQPPQPAKKIPVVLRELEGKPYTKKY